MKIKMLLIVLITMFVITFVKAQPIPPKNYIFGGDVYTEWNVSTGTLKLTNTTSGTGRLLYKGTTGLVYYGKYDTCFVPTTGASTIYGVKTFISTIVGTINNSTKFNNQTDTSFIKSTGAKNIYGVKTFKSTPKYLTFNMLHSGLIAEDTSITTESNDSIVTTAMLKAYAANHNITTAAILFNGKSDTNFTHTTGNETLYGTKTFVNKIVGTIDSSNVSANSYKLNNKSDSGFVHTTGGHTLYGTYAFNGILISETTPRIIRYKLDTIHADTNFVVPNGYKIIEFIVRNDSTDADTLRLGSTAGDDDIMADTSIVGTNDNLTLLARLNSTGSDMTVYISDLSWTALSRLTIWIELKRVLY